MVASVSPHLCPFFRTLFFFVTPFEVATKHGAYTKCVAEEKKQVKTLITSAREFLKGL
jgi:hypothetical protein